MRFSVIDELDDLEGKRILMRADLNTPMNTAGEVADDTRIRAVIPSIELLHQKGAIVIILSHFARPKGKVVPEMSLDPVSKRLGEVLGQEVAFIADCGGPMSKQAVEQLKPGEIALLENTRFNPGEEENDPGFAAALADLGDLYVNDAFSAAHRAHASTEGLAHLLPAYAGLALARELSALDDALSHPTPPVAALVGGAKISTKIAVLKNLIEKVDHLIIGGAMANTFLFAQGVSIGKSLAETEMAEMATEILSAAKAADCAIHLPMDVNVAAEFAANADHRITDIEDVGEEEMILDIGPKSVEGLINLLGEMKTLVWNGPLGAFEIPPFDRATTDLARAAAELTKKGLLLTVAGGGDTVAALNHAGVTAEFSHVSTAGGAFLEWLEGRELPGVKALENRSDA